MRGRRRHERILDLLCDRVSELLPLDEAFELLVLLHEQAAIDAEEIDRTVAALELWLSPPDEKMPEDLRLHIERDWKLNRGS